MPFQTFHDIEDLFDYEPPEIDKPTKKKTKKYMIDANELIKWVHLHSQYDKPAAYFNSAQAQCIINKIKEMRKLR